MDGYPWTLFASQGIMVVLYDQRHPDLRIREAIKVF
jgi:hypothetical protein